MRSAWRECDACARREIFDHTGDENFAGPAQGGDPRPDMHRNAGEVAALHVALARVHAGADLEPERADGLGDGQRAANRAGRAVEVRDEAVAGRLRFAPSVTLDELADHRVVPRQQVAPPVVA